MKFAVVYQVQILIHVRPADVAAEKCYELVDCTIDTTIRDVKQKVSSAIEYNRLRRRI